MRCELRQGVLQRDLWARRSVSNPVPGVSISMVESTTASVGLAQARPNEKLNKSPNFSKLTS